MLNAVANAPAVDFDELRRSEFARLDARDEAYLDYTGSALYAESHVSAHCALLASGVFGNPHSESGPSRASTRLIENARDRVLRFFDVDASTHDVCFTANTTAAIKLVAESYPFEPGTACVLSADAHNSVNGIREYARRGGSRIRYLPLDRELRLADPEAVLAEEASSGGGLFAFPAQSNFSGVQHPLELVVRARSLGFDVLLDIAAFAPTHALSLRACPADFAAFSFYKLLGYPTGLGALVARREALARLRRPWFAGGTVRFASVSADVHHLRPRHEAFEDGTPDFLGIAAIDAGFALLEAVEMSRLTAHVASLRSTLVEELRSLRHGNGAPVVRLYGPRTPARCGGAVSMNVCRRDGEVIPYAVVEQRAQRTRVAVRGGCFCNPGASEAAFGPEPKRLAACLTELGDDFTPEKLARCTGTAAGAIRMSVGLANNIRDLTRARDLVASFRE